MLAGTITLSNPIWYHEVCVKDTGDFTIGNAS